MAGHHRATESKSLALLMSDLRKRILLSKAAEIEIYQLELKDASREAKLVWVGLIKSRSDILKGLIDLKTAQSAAVNDVDQVANALSGIFDEQDYKSKLGKHSASDFAASGGRPFSGLGLCGHCPFFDPTLVAEDCRPKNYGRTLAILLR